MYFTFSVKFSPIFIIPFFSQFNGLFMSIKDSGLLRSVARDKVTVL